MASTTLPSHDLPTAGPIPVCPLMSRVDVTAPSDAELAAATLALLSARAPTASICPSEVARQVAPIDWRPLMPRVRAGAATLASAGQLRITQGERDIDPAAVLDGTVRGPLRLRRAVGEAES